MPVLIKNYAKYFVFPPTILCHTPQVLVTALQWSCFSVHRRGWYLSFNVAGWYNRSKDQKQFGISEEFPKGPAGFRVWWSLVPVLQKKIGVGQKQLVPALWQPVQPAAVTPIPCIVQVQRGPRQRHHFFRLLWTRKHTKHRHHFQLLQLCCEGRISSCTTSYSN